MRERWIVYGVVRPPPLSRREAAGSWSLASKSITVDGFPSEREAVAHVARARLQHPGWVVHAVIYNAPNAHRNGQRLVMHRYGQGRAPWE